jgi:hypothetical protein
MFIVYRYRFFVFIFLPRLSWERGARQTVPQGAGSATPFCLGQEFPPPFTDHRTAPMGRWDVVAEKLQHACTLSGNTFKKNQCPKMQERLVHIIKIFQKWIFVPWFLI